MLQVVDMDGQWIRVVRTIEPPPIDAPHLRVAYDSRGHYRNDPNGMPAIDVTVPFFSRLLDKAHKIQEVSKSMRMY